MYDPIETDISYKYLEQLKDNLKGLRWAVIGGWGIFFQVQKEYSRAFGREYLKSRDIDVFIDSKDAKDFLQIIKRLGFKESSYKFRYELIYDREEKKLITSEKAKQKHIFHLIYVFLDVFSDKETKYLGSWAFSQFQKAKIENIQGFPVLDILSLLNLKILSFFDREKLDKELKDACDIFALLNYAGKKIKVNIGIKKGIEKIISRSDIQEYIAEQVLADHLKSNIVISMLKKFIV